jgi:flagellar operon protein
VTGVSPIARPGLGPTRQGLDAAPGFGQALDGLLQKPAAPAPTESPPVSFSKHAAARLASRGIELGQEELAELGRAVDQLGRRGAKESLVLLGDNAFIVGVPSRRVVTALSRQEAVGNVFTQIDSTFVVR